MNLYSINKNKSLLIILFFGFVIRLLFTLYGAEIYFNRPNIHINGDTWAWQNCIENLINNGTFTVGGNSGQFSRMPGYAFFMGIFYLLCEQDWTSAVILIGWFQTLLDVVCIFLFYKISFFIFKNNTVALISGLLYGFYPFIIVWNPVAYAEQWSTFLMLLSLFFFFKSNKPNREKKLIFSGFILGCAALTRPQIAPLFPILTLYLFLKNRYYFSAFIKKGVCFVLPFIVIFGSWPLRNYINYDRIIFTKNSEGFKNWEKDVISFMQYTYSVKSEWDPQYTSIIKNTKTTYPEISYECKEDSIKLERAIYLSKNCGSGFSRKKGFWKNPIKENEKNCNDEIAKLFNELREKQIRANPVNFYLIVPLENLKKAVFKNKLYDNKSIIRKAASLLFYYRTIMIVIGIVGLIIMIKNKLYNESLIILLFFVVIYLTLCFGTAPFMRNVEIRYFLPADILLLLSASYLLSFLFKKKLNLTV